MMRETPFAFSIGASMPTRWQLPRGILCFESGCDSEHMIAVAHFGGDLDDAVDAAGEFVGLRLQLAAGLRQMLVADAVLVK